MKGHHGAQLLGPTARETPFGPVVAHQVHVQTPLAVLQLQARAKRAADGVTEAVRALGCLFDLVRGIVPQEELAAEADVFTLRACCSSLRFLRRGAQTTRTGRSCFLWTGQPDPRDRTL